MGRIGIPPGIKGRTTRGACFKCKKRGLIYSSETNKFYCPVCGEEFEAEKVIDYPVQVGGA
jgi:ribosomal protein S27E